MQLKLKHTMLFLSLCAAFSACNERNALDNPTGKTPIELSVGGVDSPEPALTRAVITDGTGKTLNAFDVNTKIFMVMKSEYGQTDYQGLTTTKYNVARGDVNASENDNTNNRSIVKFDTKNQRYWDDAHARSSQLSIWAYAQKGQPWTSCKFGNTPYNTDTDPTQPYAWTTTEIVPTILTWRASHQQGTEAQNQTSVQAQDLLFSNNLANYDTDPSTDPSKDKRLKFNFTTRKFPQVGDANMIFYHAMSKITIKIVEGDGFNKSATTDFQFTPNSSNVKLSGFNHTGKFDIKQGEFTEIASNGTTDIPSINLKPATPTASEYYTLEALAIPSIANNGASRFVSGKKDLATDVMMEFTIDNNKYQITSGQLYDALHENGDPSNALVGNATKKTDNGTYIPLEAGKNYVFTFTVGKTKIKDITAQVVGWEDVEADPCDPSNARIKLQLEERGVPVTAPVDIYRAADNASTVSDTWESYKWTTGYVGNKNVFKEISSAWKLENDWFWDNNMTYYHFRAIMPSEQTVQTDATPNPKEDYVSLSSAVSYTDVLWGAPMRDVANNEDPDDFKFIYDKDKGFDVKNSAVDANKSQIYQAIGPTEDKLKLTLFHMMSDLTIKIKTTTGADAVTLVDGGGNKTKVQLEGHYANGTVLLGTGLIKTTGSATAKDRTAPAIDWNSVDGVYQVYKYGVVPQGLTGVQLRITTPDKNEYIVDLGNLKVSTEPTTTNIANPYTQSAGKYIIDRWYPGFKYTYTFTLKKKGIVDLQATIVDWENVTAGDDNVQIQ